MKNHFNCRLALVFFYTCFQNMGFSQSADHMYSETALSNVEITISETLQVFGKELPKYDGKITITGIDVNVNGQLAEQQAQLKQGLNHLTFELSGDQKRDTYIMLDFYDVNNQTQCYYFQNKLS